MLEEEKVVAPESEDEVVEIEDLDAGIKKEDVNVVEQEVTKKVTEQHVLNPEQQELFKEVLEAAKMPVTMTDAKFQLGENELDIRHLSKTNKEQMMFRTNVLSNVYLKQCLTSLVDITRLLMVIADKLGVENIVGATDEIIDKIDAQTKFRDKLKKAKEENNKA